MILAAVTGGVVLNYITAAWFAVVFVFLFVGWIKAGADMVDLPYGVFVVSAIPTLPVLFLFALISWIFGFDDYIGMGMVRELSSATTIPK